MKIYKEISQVNFEAWSGAVNTLNGLTFKQCNELEAMLEDIYPEGISATQLNDILWFEEDWIAELFGFKNWEHLERANKGYEPIIITVEEIEWRDDEDESPADLPTEYTIRLEDENDIEEFFEEPTDYISKALEEAFPDNVVKSFDYSYEEE